MSEFGSNGPFKWGTAAQFALLTTGDLAVGDTFYVTDTGDKYRCSDATGPVMLPCEDDPGATLATLMALGTDDGIAVGQRRWVSDHGVEAECLTALAATSTWGVRWTETIRGHGTTSATGADRYFVVMGTGVASSIGATTRVLADHPGEVRSMSFRCANDPGAMSLKTFLNESATAVESQAATPGATTYVQKAFSATSIVQGDRLTLGAQFTNDPGIF